MGESQSTIQVIVLQAFTLLPAHLRLDVLYCYHLALEPLLNSYWHSGQTVWVTGGHRCIKKYQKTARLILLVTLHTTYKLWSLKEVAFLLQLPFPLGFSRFVSRMFAWITSQGTATWCAAGSAGIPALASQWVTSDDAKMLATEVSLALDDCCQQIPSPSQNTWA